MDLGVADLAGMNKALLCERARGRQHTSSPEIEVLDFVVDARGQKLIPNPAHGGDQMTEEY